MKRKEQQEGITEILITSTSIIPDGICDFGRVLNCFGGIEERKTTTCKRCETNQAFVCCDVSTMERRERKSKEWGSDEKSAGEKKFVFLSLFY